MRASRLLRLGALAALLFLLTAPASAVSPRADPRGSSPELAAAPSPAASPVDVPHGGAPGPAPPIRAFAALERQENESYAPGTITGYSESTLVLANDSLVPGDFSAQRFSWPYELATDPLDSKLFVADYMSSAVFVFNLSTRAFEAAVPVSARPANLLFDPANDILYVLSVASNNLTIVRGATDAVVATVPIGGQHGSFGFDQLMALDPASDRLYIARYASDSVAVLSTQSESVVENLTVQPDPDAIVYDPSSDRLFVAFWSFNSTENCSYVSVLNATSGALIRDVPVGYFPDALALDAHDGRVYVANLGSNNVTVINASNDQPVATVAVGVLPDAIAYDAADATVYVVNGNYESGYAGGNVSLIATVNDTVVATVSAGLVPANILVDAENGRVFVADTGGSALTVINGSNASAVSARWEVGPDPFGMAVADSAGDLFVACFGFGYGGTVVLVNGTSGSVSTPLDPADAPTYERYDSANGQVYVEDTVTGELYAYDASSGREVGAIDLGPNVDQILLDNVTDQLFVGRIDSPNLTVIDGANDTIRAEIPVGGTPAAMSVDLVTGDLYVAEPWEECVLAVNMSSDQIVANLTDYNLPIALAEEGSSGNVLVLDEGIFGYLGLYYYGFTGDIFAINGSSFAATGSVALGPNPTSMVYDPTDGTVAVFDSAEGRLWLLDAANLSTEEITSIGGYSADLLVDPSNGDLFDLNYAGTNVSLISGTTGQVLASAVVGAEPASLVYDPALGALFVPNFYSNNLTVINAQTFLTGSIPVGTEPFRVAVIGNTGRVWVTNYAGGTVTIVGGVRFLPVYAVGFTETGLPSMDSWKLSIGDNRTREGRVAYRTVYFANGSYPYILRGPNGYEVEGVPPAGSVSVDGSSVYFNFRFVSGATPTVIVGSHHLPWYAGEWCFVLAQLLTRCLTQGREGFADLSPGNYAYSITGVAGYDVIARVGPHEIPLTGVLSVHHHDRVVSLDFQNLYPLSILIEGLPAGTEVTVTVRQQVYELPEGISVVDLDNGTYRIHIDPVAGYRLTGTPVHGRIRGGGGFATLRFVPRGPSVTAETREPSGAAPAARVERASPG